MTAEEIRDKYIPEMPSSVSQLSIAIVNAMEEYASQKCKEQRESDIVNFLVWYQGRSDQYRHETLFIDVAKEYADNPIPHHLRNKPKPQSHYDS